MVRSRRLRCSDGSGLVWMEEVVETCAWKRLLQLRRYCDRLRID